MCKALHLVYVCFLWGFIYYRSITLQDPFKPLGIEGILWTLNFGYISYEVIEAFDKGQRGLYSFKEHHLTFARLLRLFHLGRMGELLGRHHVRDMARHVLIPNRLHDRRICRPEL